MIWRMLQLLSTDHPATAHLSPPHLSPPVRSALLRALTPLASHSVSVSELKLLFSLLAQQHVDASDCMLAELLTTISSMLQQQGPAGSFLLDGHNSGIQLPPIPKFSQTGYTFYTWLRVDSFGASLNTRITRPEMDGGEVDSELSLSPPPTTRTGRSRSSLKPRLLSLRDDQSRGLELYFYPHSGETACLRMRTYSSPSGRASRSDTLDFRVAFKPDRWYHLGITHVASRLFAKSEVRWIQWRDSETGDGRTS